VSPSKDERLRVLRVYHSGVVAAWRQRDRQLNSLGAEVTLISPARWNEGGTVVHLDAGGDTFVRRTRTLGRHPYRFLYEPLALWRVLRRERFDLIDVHEEPASLAAAEVQLIAWLAGHRSPFCLYSAENVAKRYPPPFRWLERIALRRAAAVHTCNDGAEAILRGKGFDGMIRNLGLGVDIERFAPARTDGGRRLRVGYVGRLEAHKGVAVLVDAVARVAPCSLEIVGDGPQRTEIAQQINNLGLGPRVRMTGFVPHHQLPEVYRRFDVIAVPSVDRRGSVEQFGRSAVEAMASGLPVVASNSGSLAEVVGEAGVLVPPGDATALASALQGLSDDPTELRRLGAAARAGAKRYSWPAIARRHLHLYQEMLRAG
jgi:glycosyltransferase involved in cell wall biosynthesis